jgi:ankyrin repeat protein
MFCPQCGEKIDFKAVFCPNCGAKIKEVKPIYTVKGKKLLQAIKIGIPLLILICIVIVGYTLFSHQAPKPLKYSTIHEAAAKGDIEDVKNHLRRGTAVNARYGPFSMTPLHIAAETYQTKIAEFLIEKGADVNAETIGYDFRWAHIYPIKTPLEIAAFNGFKEMVELLIKKGANLEKYGSNAINLAVAGFGWINGGPGSSSIRETSPELLSKMDHIGVIKTLIKHGVKPDDYSLIYALDDGYVDEKKESSLEIIRLLIEGGANVNVRDEDGKTPLDKAETLGKKEIIDLLREYGAKK